jgi:hypothetical protein
LNPIAMKRKGSFRSLRPIRPRKKTEVSEVERDRSNSKGWINDDDDDDDDDDDFDQ